MSRPRLHLHQKTIWKSSARFKVAVCGRRFGKTWIAIERLTFLSQNRKHLYWYVAPTFSAAKDLLWEPLKEYWDSLKWRYTKNEQSLTIKRLSTGTVIQLKSAEKERSMRGRGLNGIFFDEYQDIDKKIWKAVRPALSDKIGFAEFYGTPKGFNHFHEIWVAAKTRPNWESFHFKTIDSPIFQTPEGKQEIEDARRDLDERTFNQEYEASFETFGGRICYAFDRNKHHTNYEYDPKLPIYVGQDFNRNPMSGVLFQKVAGQMLAFSEMKILTSSTEEICQIIRQRYPQAAKHFGVYFRPDATGKRLTSNTSRSDHQIIRENGFTVETRLANPRKVDRWAACNRALEKNLVLINTDKCPNLTNELETICYKEGTCVEDIKDPLVGHIFDGFGYNIYYEFPIIKRSSVRVQHL